jgi:hypothetical protein
LGVVFGLQLSLGCCGSITVLPDPSAQRISSIEGDASQLETGWNFLLTSLTDRMFPPVVLKYSHYDRNEQKTFFEASTKKLHVLNKAAQSLYKYEVLQKIQLNSDTYTSRSHRCGGPSLVSVLWFLLLIVINGFAFIPAVSNPPNRHLMLSIPLIKVMITIAMLMVQRSLVL